MSPGYVPEDGRFPLPTPRGRVRRWRRRKANRLNAWGDAQHRPVRRRAKLAWRLARRIDVSNTPSEWGIR